MQKKVVLTITDFALICSPLLILFFILVLEGAPLGNIFKLPEWSFISIMLLVECFRDFEKVWRSRGEHEEQIDGGYAFAAILLVVVALILAFDYRHSNGKSPYAIEVIYATKFLVFGFCSLMFIYIRWKRHGVGPMTASSQAQ